MTAVPVYRQPSSNNNAIDSGKPTDAKPVLALKELVASLYREQNKIQNLLSSLGFALRSFNNLNQFLELTPLMAARVTDADGGALILFKSNGRISLEQLHCQDNQATGQLRRDLEKIVRQLNISDHQTTEPFPLSLSEHLDRQIRQTLGTQSQLYSTPVLVKNTERGRLYVFSNDPEYAWTQTRRKLLQLVADQTAVAIANNELTIELRSKERQDRELEIASEIQLRLLPRKCPLIKGVQLAARCQTANRVGGDYYDFIPTNYDQLRQPQDGKVDSPTTSVPWSIVIGDVMGKGVPAGLIMTMTRGMLRAEVLNRHTPAQILEHLNRVMFADLENSHRFVTLFYSEYDPQTRILSYSNAAHHPPLLWQASTGTIQRLDTEGMLIGLDPQSSYENAQTSLSEGDTIIYYTDGFTDAVNQSGDRFEEENLIQAFEEACQIYDSPQGILDHLFDKVHQFSGSDQGNSDDMTLVVMQIKSQK
ncbi:protein serine/threonine phosphatase [Gloeothece citriformis PCC 7424]|uniref:Protein serine/threonine phosphatase n=1 Tax=Gloeothece citriformis (strain PCC 7424) TaxID=65393 RepID=B7K8U8_GLOC7|nr:PP2C family protein-serine/threonine phosphatase [Gloeothece citriformis]ACK71296.1 protein serine/threonine phosphatase [Gloeothece citriformis PCC 7424]